MKARHLIRCLAVVGALASLACADITAPTSPVQKKSVSPTAPVGAVYSRWMLISGVWVCTERCDAQRPSKDGAETEAADVN
jgi:hypothetical protein